MNSSTSGSLGPGSQTPSIMFVYEAIITSSAANIHSAELTCSAFLFFKHIEISVCLISYLNNLSNRRKLDPLVEMEN
jgi:hypothetical protein